MPLLYTLVNGSLRVILRSLCRIDDAQLPLVPESGPLILVANHINFLDVPVLATHLGRRPVTAFAKSETWNNPIIGSLFTMWGAIPIRRGEPDLKAFRLGEKALASGKILAIAPEGTRSKHGSLQRGYAGVVLMAQRTSAPLLPLVYYGNEDFSQNLKRLRRTNFNIVVGRVFHLRLPERISSEVRQEAADEIMYQLAALLPPAYRGYYADLSQATTHYLCFDNQTAPETPLVSSRSLQPAG